MPLPQPCQPRVIADGLNEPANPADDIRSNPDFGAATIATGTSSASSAKPIGSIHNPAIGKNQRTPPTGSNDPAGIRSQRLDGCLKKRSSEFGSGRDL
jgi:hypothetical protein